MDVKIFFMTIVKVFKRNDIVEGVVESSQGDSDEATAKIDAEVDIVDSVAKGALDSVKISEQKEVG